MLNVDVAVGGIDQRKIHMLAREELPGLGFKAPICIHTPILVGLDGDKMSSSSNNFISMDDNEKTVGKKIRKAFCPEGSIADNPVLALFKYHIIPRFNEITIERPEKFGGNLYYPDYDKLEADFGSKNLHPMDLKSAGTDYINRILEPVRKKM